MGFWGDFFGQVPCPPENRDEVNRLVDELLQIARQDDFLSEHPGGVFNAQCKHVRARAIGKRLEEINGVELMEWTYEKVKKKLGKKSGQLAEHLGYCWNDLGAWKY